MQVARELPVGDAGDLRSELILDLPYYFVDGLVVFAGDRRFRTDPPFGGT
jgi:hypothetical protein